MTRRVQVLARLLVAGFEMEDAEPFSRCGGVETLRTRDDAMRVVATDILAMPVLE